ncbi:MAG: hypothetical protein ACUVTG_08215, partial [Candidatus Oleimicrobiaceae bacterium]
MGSTLLSVRLLLLEAALTLSLPLLPVSGLRGGASASDLAVGIKDVGQVHAVVVSNGWLLYPFYRGGILQGAGTWYRGYKGYAEIFLYLDFLLGIPEGVWTPRVFDPAVGDTVSLGPAVAEGISASQPTESDWGPCAGCRAQYLSGDLLVGNMFPTTRWPELPVMATSTLPQTWPRDPYGFRKWPGAWARDPHSGRVLPGVFTSDKDLFFCFTDQGYAGRTFRGARSYPIGANVECQVHLFADSYAECVTFYELALINQSPYDYWGVYAGFFLYVEAGPFNYQGEKVDYVVRERQGERVVEYAMGYWGKTPEVIAKIRDWAGNPCLAVPHVGVMLVDTPFAASDGVDNDGDGLVDEAEGEKAGLSGWHLCQLFLQYDPSSGPIDYLERKDRDLWMYKLLSGDTSGLSLELTRAFFLPDSHGVLDPRFDARSGLALLPPQIPTNCFLVSTGPFDWPRGDTLHIVCALVMGDNLQDLKRNARTARQMYELGYQRSSAPPAPRVWAVPGDKKVKLYWDRQAEEARDPIFGYQDFEGYRIYRTTADPHEVGWGEEIRDVEGKLLGYRAVAQFDLIDGYFGPDPEYPHFNLGSESGLVHTWTDTGLVNGLTYWYSVCSYDRGVRDDRYNPEGWPAFRSLESPWGTEAVVDRNVVRVVPGVRPPNCVGPSATVQPDSGTVGNGKVEVEIVDEFLVTGHRYTVEFEQTGFEHARYSVLDEDMEQWVLTGVRETAGEEGPVFDGLRLWVDRFDTVGIWQEQSGWFRAQGVSPCTWVVSGRRVAEGRECDYEVRFQAEMESGYATGKSGPFAIWNVTTGQKVEWDIFYDSAEDTTEQMKRTWTSGDRITVREEVEGKGKRMTWTFVLSRPKKGPDVAPQPGDLLRIVTTKPFRQGDRFQVVTVAVSEAVAGKDELGRVRVVPNPYVGGAGWE